jgi:hypothetical protein
LLPHALYLQCLLVDLLLEPVLVVLLGGIEVVEALLETADLVLEGGKVTFPHPVLLDLLHHRLEVAVIHFKILFIYLN